MSIDHAAEAQKHIDWAHEQQKVEGEFDFTVRDNALIAQAEATLALVDEVKQLRESFGQCDHGYTICPFCIRSAMEGVL